ncbi:MAG: CPBP family intramembrane metalloprotease [Planctomycetaceae bacterium]|nr:CPBP family intramembrane metalloprotease [Planctomycetaceae bacterium]
MKAPFFTTETLAAFLGNLFRGPQFKATVAVLYVCVAASLWKVVIVATPDFLWGASKIVGAFVLFGLIPAGIVKLVFRETLADYGVRPGIAKFTVRSMLVVTPFMLLLGYLASSNENYLTVYPFNPVIRPGVSATLLAVHLASYLLYYAGWEFLFRGFLQKAVESQAGASTAILVQTLASTMLHYGHPPDEVFGAILGGLFWGFLAWHTRSIFAGLVQHAALGLALDYFLVYGK